MERIDQSLVIILVVIQQIPDARKYTGIIRKVICAEPGGESVKLKAHILALGFESSLAQSWSRLRISDFSSFLRRKTALALR